VFKLVLAILGLMWVLVLLPPWLRGRREGRPGASISSFNRHLSTLSRTGRSASGLRRPIPASGLPLYVGSRQARAQAARERQRDVQVGLAVAVIVLGGLGSFGGIRPFTFLGGVCAIAFAMYQFALLQEQRRSELSSRVRRFPAAAPPMRGRVAQGGRMSYGPGSDF
jgi:hypothetical protein